MTSPAPAHGSGAPLRRRLTRRALVAAAWVGAISEFYQASKSDNARLPQLVATLVPGGPDYQQETTYIAAQSVSGIAGPPNWQIGAVSVLSISGAQALVSGCSYDAGSRYRSTGAPAPRSLGGSPGLTGYLATMKRAGARWLLYSTRTTSPSSAREAGPCHDFAFDSST